MVPSHGETKIKQIWDSHSSRDQSCGNSNLHLSLSLSLPRTTSGMWIDELRTKEMLATCRLDSGTAWKVMVGGTGRRRTK
jgi:hypothetical protein